MVNLNNLQKAIIQLLKANTPLVAALTSDGDIKEAQWQGQDFIYPAIRVDIHPQYPIGNGVDRLILSRGTWSVRTYSTQNNSYQANNLMGLVIDALFNKQWSGTDNSDVFNFNVIRVNIINVDNAMRLSNRLWMATAMFDSQLNILKANTP